MAELSISSVVRELLTLHPEMSAAEVVKRAKAKGLNASAESIRHRLHNLRAEYRQRAQAVPALASRTESPAPVASAPKALRSEAPASGLAPPAAQDLAAVFANVVLVDRVRTLCGGTENARHVVEAVRACGGVDPFLLHLDLVAGLLQGQGSA